MSRVTYDPKTVGGELIARAVAKVREAQSDFLLAKSMADGISGGGATPAALEGSAEFGVETGDGAECYGAIANMVVYLSDVTTTAIADLYQGD